MTQGVFKVCLRMFLRRKKNRSGTTSIVVSVKAGGKIKRLRQLVFPEMS